LVFLSGRQGGISLVGNFLMKRLGVYGSPDKNLVLPKKTFSLQIVLKKFYSKIHKLSIQQNGKMGGNPFLFDHLLYILSHSSTLK
jgi:hypothetical protein